MSIINLGTANDPAGTAGFCRITVAAYCPLYSRIQVAITNSGALAGTVTDSKGNSYGVVSSVSTTFTGAIFRAILTTPLVAGVDTITYTPPSGASSAITAYNLIDQGGGTANTPASGTSNTPDNTATCTAGQLAVGVVCYAPSTLTAFQASGFSAPPNAIASSPTAPGIIGGSQVVPTSGVLGYPPTFSSSDDWITFLIPFPPNPLTANDPNGTAGFSQVTNTLGAVIGTTVVVFTGNSTTALGAGVTDSKGNTYTNINSKTQSTTITGGVYRSVLTTALVAGDTITYTPPAGASSAMSVIALLSGYGALDLNVTPLGGTGGGGIGSLPSISGTPVGAGDLVIGCLCYAPSTAVASQGAGFSFPPNAIAASTTVPGIMAGSIAGATGGLQTYTPTLSAADAWVAFLISFSGPPAQIRSPVFARYLAQAPSISLAQSQSPPLALISVAPTLMPLPVDFGNPALPGRAIDSQAMGISVSLRIPQTPPPIGQYDWPVPKGLLPSVSWLQSFPSLLLSISIFPPLNYDWQNPKGHAQGAANLWGLRGTPANLLVPTAVPASFNYDWPVPKGLLPSVSWSHSILPTLQPTVLNPALNFDWPNPGIAQRNVSLLWNGTGTPPALISFASPAAAQPRAPFFYRSPDRDSSASINAQPQSSSLALLSGPQAVPQFNYDWPNPKGYIPGVANLWNQVGIPVELIARPASFNYDWPVPKGAPPNVSWLQSTPQTLQSIPTFPQFNYDWPNPKGYIQGVTNLWGLIGTQASLITPTAVPASFQYDWPVPKGLLPSVSWLQSTPQTLRSILTIPQFNFDWPNPGIAQRNVSLLWNGAATSPALLTQNANPVIAQYDWPVPMAPLRSVYLSWAQPSPTVLVEPVPPSLLVIPPDFGNPAPAVRTIETTPLGASAALLAAQAPSATDEIRGPVFTRLWTTDPSASINSQIQQNLEALYQSVITPVETLARKPTYIQHLPRDSYTSITSQPQSSPTTLLLTQVPPPFNYDWPVPKGYLSGSSIYVAAWGTASNLITPTGSPFLNYDWPNPKGPLPTPRWEVSGIPTGLLTPINIPAIAQYDWPVPRGYDRGVANLWGLWGTPASIITPTGIPASFNYDWPVPKGAAPTPRWEVANSPTALLAQIRAFAQYDWPNPIAAQRSAWLLWNGQGTPSSYITPTGLPATFNFDWANPKLTTANVGLLTIDTESLNPNLYPPPPPLRSKVWIYRGGRASRVIRR